MGLYYDYTTSKYMVEVDGQLHFTSHESAFNIFAKNYPHVHWVKVEGDAVVCDRCGDRDKIENWNSFFFVHSKEEP